MCFKLHNTLSLLPRFCKDFARVSVGTCVAVCNRSALGAEHHIETVGLCGEFVVAEV